MTDVKRRAATEDEAHAYCAGRDEERRRTIAFLIKLGLRLTAVRIEAGDHWGDE